MSTFENPQQQISQVESATFSARLRNLAGRLVARRFVDKPIDIDDRVIPDNLKDFVETDTLISLPLPKIDTINLADRNIEVETVTHEHITEAAYISRFIEDMHADSDFVSKTQWFGEKELVHALAEQSKWLAGRVLAGERVAVINEPWNRKDSKSGGYITRLITDNTRALLQGTTSKQMGAILTGDELQDGTAGNVDRVVLFDDWVVSGHDMGQRIRQAKRLMEERNLPIESLNINLLAAQSSIVKEGFNRYRTDTDSPSPLKVNAPYVIEEDENKNPSFSGIHSSTDYAFTFRPETREAMDRRNSAALVNGYQIDSIYTFGNPDFYNQIVAGVSAKLQ